MKISRVKRSLFFWLHAHVFFVSFIDGLFSLHTLTPLTSLLGKQVQFHQFQHARTEMTHQILHSKQCPGKKGLCPPRSTPVLGSKSCALAQVLTARLEDPVSCGDSSLKLCLTCRTLLNTSTHLQFQILAAQWWKTNPDLQSQTVLGYETC